MKLYLSTEVEWEAALLDAMASRGFRTQEFLRATIVHGILATGGVVANAGSAPRVHAAAVALGLPETAAAMPRHPAPAAPPVPHATRPVPVAGPQPLEAAPGLAAEPAFAGEQPAPDLSKLFGDED